jgi:hypothetical protein
VGVAKPASRESGSKRKVAETNLWASYEVDDEIVIEEIKAKDIKPKTGQVEHISTTTIKVIIPIQLQVIYTNVHIVVTTKQS